MSDTLFECRVLCWCICAVSLAESVTLARRRDGDVVKSNAAWMLDASTRRNSPLPPPAVLFHNNNHRRTYTTIDRPEFRQREARHAQKWHQMLRINTGGSDKQRTTYHQADLLGRAPVVRSRVGCFALPGFHLRAVSAVQH